ncbi:hypothetical protein CDD81_6207 [Ophiocordyceps australis]|uniref:Uncharacterized protein n=1 Tax=Ophiocordyceps australis TaxID=1399860 RepID=A0A2C5Y635_9HYPO|nr:hypothetical protein CDD81_6207 [Ophiocordyceps australis]
MKLYQAALFSLLLADSSTSCAAQYEASALMLDGVDETSFNKAHEPFTVRSSFELKPSSCSIGIADARANHRGYDFYHDAVVTPKNIALAGLAAGHVNLAIHCQGVRGQDIAAVYALTIGAIDMPVQVVNAQKQPIVGAEVTARLGAISQQHTTNASGLVTLTNLPAQNIELFVMIPGDQHFQSETVEPKPRLHQVDIKSIKSRDDLGVLDSSRQAKSPMRQPECQDPLRTCDFYVKCAEQTLHCGPNGYPLHWGNNMCHRFQAQLQHYSVPGREWIWNTMACLQRALIAPLDQDGATCDSIQQAAFKSHPTCYIENGVCNLSLSDVKQLIITIHSSLLVPDTIKQILETIKGCARDYLSEIAMRIHGLEAKAARYSDPEAFSYRIQAVLLKRTARYLPTKRADGLLSN